MRIKMNHSPCTQEAGRPQERADEQGLAGGCLKI